MLKRFDLLIALAIAPWLITCVIGAEVEHEAAKIKNLKPVEPADVVATFAIAPGFRAELIAAEPLVRDPISLEFDENGAAYVIELPTYNKAAKPAADVHGSIRRLDDVDGDGRFDRSTVFADDVNYPTGLICYGGGLIVGNSPDLLWLRDSDGDGRADEREVLLTGFGQDRAGEGQLNSFRWGLDNRIHISTGIAGGVIRSPGAPAADAVPIGNRRIVWEPRAKQYEWASGGGQFGMTFDDWGRLYVCDNSQPAMLLMYDDRYLARNPLMSAPPAAQSIAPGGESAKVQRISPVDPWRLVPTKMPVKGLFSGPEEGWKSTGFFTSATGITVYRGDAWPESHRGSVIVGEPANNLVRRMTVTPRGVGAIAERADAAAEFLASRDTWFRPVQFSHGPDGALVMIDMYRELIEGAMFLPPDVLAQLDPLAGCDRGRIYRIVPAGFKQPAVAPLGSMSMVELVAQLEHPNGWRRDTAARLLYQRQDATAVEPLRRLLSESKAPLGRLHAMHALDGLGALKEGDVLRGLADEQSGVREHAVKLAERFAASSPAIQQALVGLVEEGDIRVRYQLAFSAGYLPNELREHVLVKLLKRDGGDSWFRLAVQSSLSTGAPAVFAQLLADAEYRDSAAGRQFLAALARQIGRGKHDAEVEAVVQSVDGLPASEGTDALAKFVLIAAMDQRRGTSSERLISASRGRSAEIVAALLANAGDAALDAGATLDDRLAAVETLASASFAAARAAIDPLLLPSQPDALQSAALDALGRFDDPGVAELLLEKWPGFTPHMRAAAAEVLLARPALTVRLLDAVQNKAVAATDLDPARVALLQAHPDEAIRQQAAAAFADVGLSRRADVVAAYQPALAMRGDVERGRKAFRKTCASCHELEQEGNDFGADLHAIRDRGPAAVLLNILDPNREVKPQYLAYVASTVDGLTVSGLIAAETANDLTLRRADGSTLEVPRAEIESIQSTGMSFMPEGLEQQVDVPTMADLLAYLNAVN